MCSRYELDNVNDDLLIDRLKTIVAKNNEATAVLLAYLAEVDARKLYLPAACSSIYDYCIGVLHLAEGSALKRIRAARAARQFPIIFELVANGSLHLSGITVLAPVLTEENHRELLAGATHKSKRAIEELVAAIAPKPDVPSSMRKLPQQNTTPPLLALAASAATVSPAPGATNATNAAAHDSNAPNAPNASNPSSAPKPLASMQSRPVVAPLSEDRFKVQFTASRSLRDKIATAQALMRHQNPRGDLEQIFEKAIDVLLAELNRKKFAAIKKPTIDETETAQASATKEATRRIPAAVRRAVVKRDGLRCSFLSPSGARCEARAFLEFHHVDPFARGGKHSVKTVRIFCRAHNGHQADQDYGADFMQRKRDESAAAPGP